MDKMILGNRYEIVEKIGEGGMAKVFKAKDRLLNRCVAIKVLKNELRDDDEFVNKFGKEAKAAASLSHPNIVNVYDVGQDDGIRYIVMELVEGTTLKDIIIRNNDKFLSNNDIIDISYQIASALEHAHNNNIIHRDIKPENIIINDDGLVKVADFGIARAVTTSTIVNTTKMLGSVHYSSPEQVRGGFVDKRTDIYSLGILIYELSTNRIPFNGETPVSIAMKHINKKVVKPSEINPNLSSGIEKIILKSIRKKLDERYETTEDLLSDLEKASRRLDHEIIIDNKIIDNSETKYLPVIEDDKIMAKKRTKNKKSKKSNSKKPSAFMTLVVILGALLVSLGIFTIISLDDIKDNLKNEIVIVPNVEGLEAKEGIKKLNELGFSVDATKRKFSSEIKKGYIISQTNKEGEKLKKGYTIEVVISKGTELITVPNTIHEDFVNAKITLENKNLILGEVNYEYSDLPADTVIDQSPLAGKQVSLNSKINLTVSQGVESKYILMPRLIDLTLEEAKSRLESINLSVGKITYKENLDYENGIINSQGVNPGSDVEEGTSIDLVITKNPENANNNGGDTSSESVEEGDLVEKVFIVPLNFEEEKSIVKVEKVQDGNSEVVYEKEHSKSEGSVRVIIKARGEATIKFYYGDKLISQQKRKFE